MERNLVRSNIIAGEDLTGKEYYLVGVDGKLTTATGQQPYGIVEVAAASGAPIGVVVGGEYWVYVGEAVSAGDPLTGGADGKAMKATNGTIDTSAGSFTLNLPFAIALEDAQADSLCLVLIR